MIMYKIPEPCPWCRGTNIDERYSLGPTSQSAGCLDCGASGPSIERVEGESLKADLEAMAAWDKGNDDTKLLVEVVDALLLFSEDPSWVFYENYVPATWEAVTDKLAKLKK